VTGTRGFTLTELVVATLVLTVGVLALAGTAAAVSRMLGWGQRMGGSAVAAATEFERLRSAGCAALSGGRDSSGRYRLQWTVAVSGSLRTVALTVSYPNGRSDRTDRFEAAAWCP
jgi:prepilin-type N-terminal cleavage/methylation domain-containing protein